jgi:uncharacterized protein (DUF58 family)
VIRQSATDDFLDLRRYAPGGTPRRINRRVFMRRNELPAKCFDGDRGEQTAWLDFADCPGDTEARLAQFSAWTLAAGHAGHDFGLHLPGVRIAPAIGRRHRDDGLCQFACLGKTETSEPAHPSASR